jgi:Tfp pilus assembly protein PilF
MFNPSIPFISAKKNHPADMANLLCSVICVFLFSACGAMSPYHQSALDTPARHVDNGMKFLQIDKIDAAVSEFSRAIELDPGYAPAYSGMGLAYGRMGNFVKGFEFMDLATDKAKGYEQKSAIKDARIQLETMKNAS